MLVKQEVYYMYLGGEVKYTISAIKKNEMINSVLFFSFFYK